MVSALCTFVQTNLYSCRKRLASRGYNDCGAHRNWSALILASCGTMSARDRTLEFRRLVDVSDVEWSVPACMPSPTERAMRAYKLATHSLHNEIPLEQLATAALSAIKDARETCVSAEHEAHLVLVAQSIEADVCDKRTLSKRNILFAEDSIETGCSPSESGAPRVLQQLAAPQTYHEPRAKQMRAVRRKLLAVSSLHSQVAKLVDAQSSSIDALDYRVSRSEERVDAVRKQLYDAAPRVYQTWPRSLRNYFVPHSLSARLRCGLVGLIIGNVALIYIGFL